MSRALVPSSQSMTFRQGRRLGVSTGLVRARGLVQAERVEAAAFVTHVALHHVAMLTELEGRLIAMVPMAEPRLKAIGDAFAYTAASLVAEMAL